MKWTVWGLAAAGVLAVASMTGCDSEARARENRMNNRLDEMQMDLDGKMGAVNNEITMLRANPPVVVAPPSPAPVVAEVDVYRIDDTSASWRKNELERLAREQQASLSRPAATSAPAGSLAAKHIRIPQSVTTVQAALRDAGFYQGAIDGKVGKQTIAAIQGFQRSQGLAADGVVGRATWARLEAYAPTGAPRYSSK